MNRFIRNLEQTQPLMGHVFLFFLLLHLLLLQIYGCKIYYFSQKKAIMYDFLVYGLPRKVVTDNSPTFSSEEFQQLMGENGIFSTP